VPVAVVVALFLARRAVPPGPLVLHEVDEAHGGVLLGLVVIESTHITVCASTKEPARMGQEGRRVWWHRHPKFPFWLIACL
jgi:hypothetical protein